MTDGPGRRSEAKQLARDLLETSNFLDDEANVCIAPPVLDELQTWLTASVMKWAEYWVRGSTKRSGLAPSLPRWAAVRPLFTKRFGRDWSELLERALENDLGDQQRFAKQLAAEFDAESRDPLTTMLMGTDETAREDALDLVESALTVRRATPKQVVAESVPVVRLAKSTDHAALEAVDRMLAAEFDEHDRLSASQIRRLLEDDPEFRVVVADYGDRARPSYEAALIFSSYEDLVPNATIGVAWFVVGNARKGQALTGQTVPLFEEGFRHLPQDCVGVLGELTPRPEDERLRSYEAMRRTVGAKKRMFEFAANRARTRAWQSPAVTTLLSTRMETESAQGNIYIRANMLKSLWDGADPLGWPAALLVSWWGPMPMPTFEAFLSAIFNATRRFQRVAVGPDQSDAQAESFAEYVAALEWKSRRLSGLPVSPIGPAGRVPGANSVAAR